MSRKDSSRGISLVFGEFRNWFGKPQGSKLRSRQRPSARSLAFEALEGRVVLTGSPGASILGTAFNDLTGNGFTADDTVLAGVAVNLFRDGGNGTFQGSAAGSDDTLVGTQTTTSAGQYSFGGLTAGTYFVQEIVPAGYVALGGASGVSKVIVTTTAAQGTAGIPIDSFSTVQSVDASSNTVTSDASSVAAPEAIGGHRDLLAQLTSTLGDVNLSSNSFGQHVLEYNSSAVGAGNRIVTWDGANNNPSVLNPTGLNHLDLTQAGKSSGVVVSIGADHDNGLLTFQVYKDANDWSTLSLPIPNTGGAATSSVYLPFSSFTTGGGSGAGDFTDVGAMRLSIQGNAAVNGQISAVNTLGPTQLLNNIGNYQPASVGDLAFWDLNKTGIQAGADPGAANVTVQLLQNGTVISTTTTNAQGAYQFTGLAPGSYSEKFIAPNGAVFTLKNQGSNPALDSDADASGNTAAFFLNSGQNDTTHDAGLLPIDLSIAKSVDNPTPTVGSNVTFTITLSNATGWSPATGVTVNDVLPAGLSFVSANPASGTSYNSSTGVWTVGNLASGASTNLTITATVTSGGTKTNVAQVRGADEPDVGTVLQASAAVTPPGSLGDLVFWDMNKNGIQNPGDAGVPNVTVQLLQNGSVVATTTTNAQGAYHFSNVAPGTYSEKFIAPAGDIFTLQNQGGDPALDSDADANGATGTFTLASGQNDTTHDAGLLPIDLSVTKSVDNPTPNVGANVTFTMTVSNATGWSAATGVTVSDVLPAGLSFVSATPGGSTSYNSSTGVWTVGNLASGASASLAITATVTSGGTKTNVVQVTAADEPDAGTVLQASASVTPPASVGDFVFWDLNKSGIQTGGNSAGGVKVELLQNGNVIATTSTNAQGFYHFTGLAPGSYSEKFIAPNGAVFTLEHQGSDPALDSDADASGNTSTFTLASGENNTTIDAGLLPIDLSIAKSVDNPTPVLGNNVTFTITLNNAAGWSPATGVKVGDLLPAGLTFVSATPAAGTTYDSTTGVWNVGNLASGASTTLIVTATAATLGTKTNVAQVTVAAEPDIGSPLQASAAVNPSAPPPIVETPQEIDLSIAKTVNNPTPKVGTNVIFTITLSNATGFLTATGVTVNDALPPGLAFVSATAGAGSSCSSGTGVWTVNSLASGASTTLTITATVTASGISTNTATVTGADEPDIGTVLQASASVIPPTKISKAMFLGR